MEIETAVIGPKYRSFDGSVRPSKTNKFIFFSQENYCKSMSDAYSTFPNQNLKLKYCSRCFSPHINFGSAQWTLHGTLNFVPTTIKYHVVKIVITWSISPDEITNIGPVYCVKNCVQPKELEVRSLNHPYSLKTKSSQCHYVVKLNFRHL